MISLVLPYWDRFEAATASLKRLADLYQGLDLEVIVVDDGSPQPFEAPPGLPIDVQVIRLPKKTVPLNPCVPINVGVAAARGEVIALSNPENLHRGQVLNAMLDELSRGSWQTYVMAAAWHVEGRCWHCHSSLGAPVVDGVQMPSGSHYHFMSMMRRELWDAARGFDEDYREGAGYDDPDFVLRLARAGARFVLRDDLVVDHVRTKSRASWSPAMFMKNRSVFLEKWAKC